jgi:hypothetical protein
MDASQEYQQLLEHFADGPQITAGQMFGKPCIKFNSKAFVAQHKETLVFKLSGESHAQALARPGAALWDPSGKGRAMKEWVALPTAERANFNTLADAALAYLLGQA